MNRREAVALMTRIVDTWPAGRWSNGTIAEWTHDLEALDSDIAERARQRLRRELRERSGPTFAQFVECYRAEKPRDEGPRRSAEPIADPRPHIAAIRAQLAQRGRHI